MRLHRFIIDIDLSEPTAGISDPELVSQWKNVLRLEAGDKVILSDGRGREAEATITEISRSAARFQIGQATEPDREPKKQATLYCALLKRENFEVAIQKATEIGIARIVPLLTERTVKTGFNRERLEKILREAAEQSGRTTVPELAEPMAFRDAVASADPKDSVLFDLDGEQVGASLAASNAFIGPEGGFSDAEVALAKEAGFRIGLMGSLTMRGETAAVIASYLVTR